MIRRAMHAAAILSILLTAVTAAESAPILGGGLHYLRTVGDIKDDEDFDENAFGIMGSLTFPFPLGRVEGIVEWVPDYGRGDTMIQPQAWAMLGGILYGGVGIGIGHTDGAWQDQPFYGLRAGSTFGLLGLHLDGFATYHFQSMDDLQTLEKKDFDAVTFGALVRLGG